jgi:hypothetical protein
MMSWTLYSFQNSVGTILLPASAPQEDVDTGDAEGVYTRLASGGALDSLWNEKTWPDLLQISRRGLYLTDESTTAHDQLNALLAYQGSTGKLWRRHVLTNEFQWTYVRFRRAAAPFTPANVFHIAVDMAFDRVSRAWFGKHRGLGFEGVYESSTFDSSYVFEDDAELHSLTGSGTTDFVVDNGGNTEVADAIVTVTPGDAPVTSIVILCGRAKLVWSGTLPASGQTFIINTGSKDVVRRTTLTANLGIGSTALTLEDTTGYVVGDLVEIDLDNGDTALRTVATIPTSTTMSINSPVPTNAGIGRGVRGNAYSGFSLDTISHTISDWLRLSPEANLVSVVLGGGGAGSTILFDFYEAWK